jgi:hypothetical protein
MKWRSAKQSSAGEIAVRTRSAKLSIITRGMMVRQLDSEQIADLERDFKLRQARSINSAR